MLSPEPLPPYIHACIGLNQDNRINLPLLLVHKTLFQTTCIYFPNFLSESYSVAVTDFVQCKAAENMHLYRLPLINTAEEPNHRYYKEFARKQVHNGNRGIRFLLTLMR